MMEDSADVMTRYATRFALFGESTVTPLLAGERPAELEPSSVISIALARSERAIRHVRRLQFEGNF